MYSKDGFGKIPLDQSNGRTMVKLSKTLSFSFGVRLYDFWDQIKQTETEGCSLIEEILEVKIKNFWGKIFNICKRMSSTPDFYQEKLTRIEFEF